MLTLITLLFIFFTALLIRSAKLNPSVKNYLIVIFAGVITFLFEPSIHAWYQESADGGAVQLASTTVGAFAIIWSIVKIIKLKRQN